ncbi:MAG: Gfo/Idh/MocA family oxidoreductase [Candidatus Sumerlaeia bacterium]
MGARICVVGAGRWGKNHVRTLQELGFLGGVVETDKAERARLAKHLADVPVFGRLEEAFVRNFDGYTVATPAETHFNVASRIIEHGKPLLVEKPMALTAREAHMLKQRADERGVSLMVGHLLLFHPAVLKIKELIDAGKIGRLQYIYSNRLNLGAVRTEENILWSFAPHDISIFQFLIGRTPLEIVSRGGAFIQPSIHDSTMTVLTYPDNIVGHIFVSWLHPFKEHRLVVIGSKGMFSYEDSSAKKELLFYEKGIDWVRGEPVKREGATEIIPFDEAPPLAEELRYFVEHLKEEPQKATAASAVEVLDILEQATESMLTRREVRPAAAAPEAPYFVHESSYVDDGAQIGAGTKIWHFSHVLRGARIGRDCVLGQNVNVSNNVVIGDHVKIQNNVSVYEGVTLEDYVFCGPSMVFTNVPDPRSKYPQRGTEHYKKTLVREGATIGANTTIVCGNTIGRHAFVGAGSVVTRDVPDYALVMGSPAKRTGWACECGEKLPKFEGKVKCPRCGRGYQMKGDALAPAE